MTRISPLSNFHEQAGALMRPYGPLEIAVPLVEAYDVIEAEYAALRKAAVILDQPQRATLEVRGADRIPFLNRMLTQELKGLSPFQVRRSFWLNRKGRIDADMRLIELPDRMYIDLDLFSTVAMGERESAVKTLSEFIFSEDIQIQDVTEQRCRLAIHGPAALAIVHRVSAASGGSESGGNGGAPSILALTPGQAAVLTIAGCEVIADRQDVTGEIGLELLMRAGDAATVYEALSVPPDVDARADGEGWKPDARGLARRIGWHAFNIARIEAGTPLFFIDFGPTSLPHETGDQTLNDRVSFKKGCYLGQEVVARMQSLGHPKQKLMAMKLRPGKAQGDAADAATQAAPMPAQTSTGCAVLAPAGPAPDAKPEVIGAVTSSAISPMLGGLPVCFAMLKYKYAVPSGGQAGVSSGGVSLRVEAEEGSPQTFEAEVLPSLQLWKR